MVWSIEGPPALEDRSLLVLHASVTGTATDCAFRIARAARRKGWRAQVKGVAEFNQVSAYTRTDLPRSTIPN